RSDLRQDADEESHHLRSRARLLVVGSKFAPVAGLIHAIDELVSCITRIFLLDLLLITDCCYARHLRNKSRNRMAIGIDGQVFVAHDLVDFESIRVAEGAL